MSKKFSGMQPDSRLDAREKKRKINKFYNIAITLVVVLIVVVGLSIFLSNNSDSDTATTEKTTKETNTASTDNKEKEKAEKVAEEEKAAEEEALKEESTEEEADESTTEDDSEAKVTEIEETDDENVEKAYKSEDWEPVGTEQSGEHVTSFDKGSADWKEMTTALSSSTGIAESDMTIWRLGNGGAPNKATGTVSAKNDDKTYRVQLEWVDGSGWRAAKVEELKQNDQR